MKTIVLSGINLFQGGPLSIYYDCLDSIINAEVNYDFKVIAFVHKKSLFENYFNKNIEFIELPKSRSNYFYRLFYEYMYFYFWSKNQEVSVWFSLHDVTPNVKANKRYVYCHNALPISELKKIGVNKSTALYGYLYKWIYKINIKKNTEVIVQQEWIKKRFIELFNINNVLVCKPTVKLPVLANKRQNLNITFFYPSFPREFKNFEIICKACEVLKKNNVHNYKVVLTIDGSENQYSKELKENFEHIEEIEWCGILSRENVFKKYGESDYLIFPSKIETWGLPITEFKVTEKPILLADLEYAHETIGDYKKVSFFNPLDYNKLANLMIMAIREEIVFDGNLIKTDDYMVGWDNLIKHLIM